MIEKHTGRCACGAVTFEFDADPTFIADCYCNDCQRSSGGVMVTYFGIPEASFRVTSGRPKSFGYVADSGNTLRRNFCPDCGARLYTDALQSFPGTIFVMLGSLDDPAAIHPPIMEIFTKRRLAWTKSLDVPQHLARPDAA